MNFFLATVICSSSFLPPSKLTVVVKNVELNKGSIVLAVFNNSDNFLKKPVAQRVIKVGSRTTELFFNLPEGNYAIAVYHDVNDNRQLDKSWLGIPKEPYGFSNNFRPKFSAPEFDDCMFNIAGQTMITIILK